MSRTSSVEFKNATRIHIGLTTSDLDRAISFYSLLLGTDPVKRRKDYAKFEADDPSVNLSLKAGSIEQASALRGHFGVQVKSTEAVKVAKQRFELAGVVFRNERDTVCCYSLQDKFWVQDPDGNAWEVFAVLDDAKMLHSEPSECCITEAPTSAASCC